MHRFTTLKNWLVSLLLFFGVCLLLLNVVGLFIPIRNDAIYSVVAENNYGIHLTYNDAVSQIDRTPDESTEQYVYRLNSLVNQGMFHYWDDEKTSEYRLRIPPYHNYLLYAGSFIRPEIYQKYEICNPFRALERGVGMCSQHAIALTGFLTRNNVPARIVTLDGHVVTEVTIDPQTETSWVADADNGVVVEKSIAEIEQNPEVIRKTYVSAGIPDSQVSIFVQIYESKGNQIFPAGVSGYIDCSRFKILIESMSFYLIWIIPILLIAPALIGRMHRKSRNTTAESESDPSEN